MVESDEQTRIDNLRQEVLTKSAFFGLQTNGEEFLPKLESISILRGILKRIIEKELEEETENNLNDIKKYIANIHSYISEIDKKVVTREDISSKRFLSYQEAFGNALDALFFMDEVYVMLLKEVVVTHKVFPVNQMTIGSDILTKVKSILSKIPPEEIQMKWGTYPLSIGEVRELKGKREFEQPEGENLENY